MSQGIEENNGGPVSGHENSGIKIAAQTASRHVADMPGAATEATRAGCAGLALPVRVEVKSIVSSRYPNHTRPLDWNARVAGRDVIETADGLSLTLWSDGQQSPPKPGWVILLTNGSEDPGYRWTLYGIRPDSTN